MIGGRRTHGRLRHGVVPINSVAHYLWPETYRRAGLRFVRRRQRTDDIDHTLRDGVEVVIMRSAGGRMELLSGAKRFELSGLQTAFVITMETSHAWARKSYAFVVDRSADERVELGHDSLRRLYDFRLIVEEFDEHVSAVLVDEESRITILTHGGQRERPFKIQM